MAAVGQRITTQRVFYIQGFLSRTTDELEIIRVDDVQYKQNITERVFGLGRVVVIAPTELTDFAPLYSAGGEGIVTQYDKGDVEDVGLGGGVK